MGAANQANLSKIHCFLGLLGTSAAASGPGSFSSARSPTLAHVGAPKARLGFRANDKRPRRGASWAFSTTVDLRVGREFTPLRLLEAGILPLRADLPKDCGIERGVGRLAAGAGPVAFLRHDLDHLLTVHRLLGLAQDASGGVDGADLLWLLVGGFGLWGLGSEWCVLRRGELGWDAGWDLARGVKRLESSRHGQKEPRRPYLSECRPITGDNLAAGQDQRSSKICTHA
jgi:hypothetical protein